LRKEIGEDFFEKFLEDCCSRFGISQRQNPEKRPQVIRTIIREAYSCGKTYKTLEEIISKIISLKQRI